MKRFTKVVTVATGAYGRGGVRLTKRLNELNEPWIRYCDIPAGAPAHCRVPYAFKPFALQLAAEQCDFIMWADACIYPIQPLDRIWERAETHGAWIANNGFRNSEWTAEAAYPDLEVTPKQNAEIDHVVATAFALSLKHPAGRAILADYIRLGLHTNAFVGPWRNGPRDATAIGHVPRQAPCGPLGVRGHRHDQTALSVIAWRAGIELTSCPDFFAYGKVDEPADPRTILLADGAY